VTAGSSYDALLDYICVDLGFCGSTKAGRPLHVSDLVPAAGMVSADQFVEWVFQAEGVAPALEHQAVLRAAFVRFMGAAAVDASRLR